MLECHDKSKQHLACMAAKRAADNPSSGALPVIATNKKNDLYLGPVKIDFGLVEC